MNGLSCFLPPPAAGYVTAQERNGEFMAVAKCDIDNWKSEKVSTMI